MKNQKELEDIVNKVTKEAEASKKEAEEKARREEQLKKEAEEKSRKEEQLKKEAEEKAKKEAAAKAQAEEQPKKEAPAGEQLSKAELQKQKMAQIREALAMVNEHSAEERAADDAAAAPKPKPAAAKAASAAQKPKGTKSGQQVKKKPSSGKQAAGNASAKKTSQASGKAAAKKPAAKASSQKSASETETFSGKIFNSGVMSKKAYASTIGGAVAVAAIISFFVVAGTYNSKFLPNTLVDTIDVAGMTTAEAKISLLQAKPIADLKLTTGEGETVVFKASDFDAQYTIPAGALDAAVSEKPFTWIGKLFNPTEYNIDYDVYFNYDKLQALIEEYDWGDDVSQNAQVVRNDAGKFEVRPETQGDQFDVYALMNYILEQMTEEGNTDIIMEDSGCYDRFRAEITEEDLIPELELYNNYANCTITYDFDDRTKVVDSHTIVDWIMTDDNGAVMKNGAGQVIFNFDAVTDFVAQMALETDTVGKDRTFNSTMDGTITVPWTDYPYSIYGWQINQEETVNQLISLMREGETTTVEPFYTQRGFCRKTDDIGNTYVDVDISAQHFWYYVDGQLMFDADFVSGTETNPGRRTPRGICQIVEKAQNVTLGTYAVQGYEQFVSYWIPFNKWGCGFHDLSRGAYGGQIYMYNGSHGCLNMRLSEVKQFYEMVEVGTPVIVHD